MLGLRIVLADGTEIEVEVGEAPTGSHLAYGGKRGTPGIITSHGTFHPSRRPIGPLGVWRSDRGYGGGIAIAERIVLLRSS